MAHEKMESSEKRNREKIMGASVILAIKKKGRKAPLRRGKSGAEKKDGVGKTYPNFFHASGRRGEKAGAAQSSQERGKRRDRDISGKEKIRHGYSLRLTKEEKTPR